jgi:hypothetical protein
MLRRPPTRIELKMDDIEEWNAMQKEKLKTDQAPNSKPSLEERIGIPKLPVAKKH